MVTDLPDPFGPKAVDLAAHDLEVQAVEGDGRTEGLAEALDFDRVGHRRRR
ncbi:MAG: hypothetical protein R2789_09240 [Microthrixaceae bacterium]